MKKKSNPSLLVVTGPTASGKTRRAVDIADRLGGEIISGDSRQVYTGMDIGTGKDLEEYGSVPFHLIDIVPAGSKYNLFRFLDDADAAFRQITERKKLPILCGGTGLYIESFIKGLRLPEVPENKELRNKLVDKTLPELTTMLSQYKTLHNSTDVDTVKRAIRAIEIQHFYAENPEMAVSTIPKPMDDVVIIGVEIDRDNRRQRITSRLKSRLEEGMLDEIRTLLDSGIAPENLIYYGLEYKFLTLYILGELTYQEMFIQLETAIHQFAKRQMTWFRGMERRGFKINWLPWDMTREEFTDSVIKIISER